MPNPILIELTRGSLVESAHAGAVALVRASGEVVASVGEIAAPIFPRSAIKPLQALPLLETGAAAHFGFGAPEIAIASGSHSGTAAHVALVASMLARAGLSEAALGCGVHEPMDGATARELIRTGRAPSPLHHNCSGKHAGMLATAVHMGEPAEGYWRPEHPRAGAHPPRARGPDRCAARRARLRHRRLLRSQLGDPALPASPAPSHAWRQAKASAPNALAIAGQSPTPAGRIPSSSPAPAVSTRR